MCILCAHFTCLWSCCGLCGLVLSSSQHRRHPCSLTFSSQMCAPTPTLEKHSLLLSESAAEWQAQLTTHHNLLAPAEAWDRWGQERSPSPSLFTLFIGQLLALLSITPFPNPLHSHLSHKTHLLSSRSCHSRPWTPAPNRHPPASFKRTRSHWEGRLLLTSDQAYQTTSVWICLLLTYSGGATPPCIGLIVSCASGFSPSS